MTRTTTLEDAERWADSRATRFKTTTPMPFTRVCSSNACDEGRQPCPTPEACRVPDAGAPDERRSPPRYEALFFCLGATVLFALAVAGTAWLMGWTP